LAGSGGLGAYYGKLAILELAALPFMSNRNAEMEVEIGDANIFEQLGLSNPEERLRKARLMNVINAAVKRRGLSQRDAAEAAGLNQADISRIQHGRGARYSTDRLLNILARLGIDVEIVQRHGSAGELVIEVRELLRGGGGPGSQALGD
jgi:predicted XRE-type DNA-binding protein